jgi:hypothetical protein
MAFENLIEILDFIKQVGLKRIHDKGILVTIVSTINVNVKSLGVFMDVVNILRSCIIIIIKYYL